MSSFLPSAFFSKESFGRGDFDETRHIESN